MQEGKLVRESQAEMVEVVLPNDANPLGSILGGKVMHLIDIAAAIDDQGKPKPIPPVIPETEEDKRRYEQAEERRRHRLQHRARPRT